MKRIIILIVATLILVAGCQKDKIREEIIDRYDGGEKKALIKFQGEGTNEKIVERIFYDVNGDTLIQEKPLGNIVVEKRHIYKKIVEKYDNDSAKIVNIYEKFGISEPELVEAITYDTKGRVIIKDNVKLNIKQYFNGYDIKLKKLDMLRSLLEKQHIFNSEEIDFIIEKASTLEIDNLDSINLILSNGETDAIFDIL